jgi:hypothetical protein
MCLCLKFTLTHGLVSPLKNSFNNKRIKINSNNIFNKGWSYECLFDWNEYLKLGIPGCIAFLIDLSYFEVGTFAAGRPKNYFNV